jgi:oxygen-independent coproporphyrinogen-3 oxidase
MIGNQVSLYIHIPFCSKKCPYCHFFVIPDKESFQKRFLAAFLREWQLKIPLLKDKQIVSIYFGGGTPTRLSLAYLAKMIAVILSSEVVVNYEMTIEANPEDVNLELLQALKDLSFNRISFGAQSFNDSELISLGRRHTAKQSIIAIQTAYLAGFENLSIDLMFELPNQTSFSWRKTLHRLRDLPIKHVSLYNLTFEQNTVFYQKKQQLQTLIPPPEECLPMLREAVESLKEMGFERYEISAFAKSKAYSLHNIGYWIGRPFLGYGPSAFSYWEKRRFSNLSHFNQYCNLLEAQQDPVGFSEQLAFPHNLYELFTIQLRLCEGVNIAAFEQRHGSLPNDFLEICERLIVEEKWLSRDKDRLFLTDKGMLFYDSVAAELI